MSLASRFMVGENRRNSEERTLGLDEVAGLDTLLQSAVEEGVKHDIARGLDVVVGLDIFLKALSAIEKC